MSRSYVAGSGVVTKGALSRTVPPYLGELFKKNVLNIEYTQ